MKLQKDEIKKNDKVIGFSKTSMIIFFVAIILLVTGYILLSKGDLKIAPVLLSISYVVLIPLAIYKK